MRFQWAASSDPKSVPRLEPPNLRDALNYCPCRACIYFPCLLDHSSGACSRNSSEDANLYRISSQTDTFALHLCWEPLQSRPEPLTASTPPNQVVCKDAQIRRAIIFLALEKPSLGLFHAHTSARSDGLRTPINFTSPPIQNRGENSIDPLNCSEH